MHRRSKKNACSIHISCEEPNEDGHMHVEMTCEGDQILVSYLLENAQAILDQNNQKTPDSKVSSIGN